MGLLAWVVHRLLLPLLLSTALLAVVSWVAWRLLLRRQLQRWLHRHIAGLQVLLNPQLAFRIQSVGLESAALQWRGGRLCWVVKGMRAALLLQERTMPTGSSNSGGGRHAEQEHQRGGRNASFSHDAAAGECIVCLGQDRTRNDARRLTPQ